MDNIHRKITRDEAINQQPEEYQRGYYDGYHKGYSDKQSAVNKAKKAVAEEWKAKLESKELTSVYPFSMIYEVLSLDGDVMLSAEAINKVLNDTLNERERRCLEMRYRDNMTLDECGTVMGVTRARIRQITAKAERKLRHPSRVKAMEVIPKADYIELDMKYQKLLSDYESLKKRLEEAEGKTVEEVKKEMTVRDKPIEHMDLSVRSYNCLRRANCKTVGDVADIARTDNIYRVRNLGKRSLEEIRSKLTEMGL